MATLRQMLALLAAAESGPDVTDWLDAEVDFYVGSGKSGSRESVALRLDYDRFPRAPANPRTGEPARMHFVVRLDKHHLSKNRQRD